MANQSMLLLFRASYTGTQVGPIIFIQGQSVYILTVLSSFRVNQSTFLLLIASYTGTQVGTIIFIQGQSVYVLIVNS